MIFRKSIHSLELSPVHYALLYSFFHSSNSSFDGSMLIFSLTFSLFSVSLLSSSRYMPQDEYQKMVMSNEILLEIDNKLTEKIEKVRENINIEPSKELFEEWKKEYRRA